MRVHYQQHQGEMEQKTVLVRQLESECSKLRVDSSQNESKVESLTSEMQELHSAMASLHGEISVLQRELEEVNEKEQKVTNQKKEMALMLEMKEAELVKLKMEKDKLDVKNSTFEIKLTEANDKIRSLRDNQIRMENLQAEKDAMQSAISQMETRLKQQTSTNQELNGLLNKLHGDIQRLQQDLNDSRDENSQIGEAFRRQEEKMRHDIESLKKSKADVDSANVAARKECESILSDMTIWKERGETLQTEQRKQTKRIEKLEREKHELFIELGQKSKDYESINNELQNAETSRRETKQLHDELKAELELMKKKLTSKDDDNEKLQGEIREIKEASSERENRLREETARCEQVIESCRAQQRENANRVVDFSQKNAKLTADLSLAQDELDKLKTRLNSTDDVVNSANREKDEVVRELNNTKVRLQSLEDNVEELTAKLEAAEAEADDCRRLHQEGSESRAREATKQRQIFDDEMRRAKEMFQTELDEKTLAAANSRRQAEQHAERTVARARETFQRQIEELQAIRKREQADFSSRTAAITSAMEGLQRELREESIKSTAASEELFALREQLERNNRDDDSAERIQRLEREKARDRVKFEGMIQALKDDLQVLGEKLDRSEQQSNMLELQCTQEREGKASLLLKYRKLEEELTYQQNAFDSANQEGSQFKKQLRDLERKAAASLNAKDAEIQRLTRRGEVLSEAVNRLSVGGTVATNVATAALNEGFQGKSTVESTDVLFGDNMTSSIRSWNDSRFEHNSDQEDQIKYVAEKSIESTAFAPPPNQPEYVHNRSKASGRESESGSVPSVSEEMPPPVGNDVTAHLARVQNALDRRRGGNVARKSDADACFGRSILLQAAGLDGNGDDTDTPSGRSTAPQLSVQDDDDLSRVSNEEYSHKSRKKRIASAPGFMSPSLNSDRRAHQPVKTILGNITPTIKSKQSKGVTFDGGQPSQFLTEKEEDQSISDTGINQLTINPRPGSNESNYVQKMRENVDLYQNRASPSPSPVKNKGGGITYLPESKNDTLANSQKVGTSTKGSNSSRSKSTSSKTEKNGSSKSKKMSQHSGNSNKLAEKAYA